MEGLRRSTRRDSLAAHAESRVGISAACGPGAVDERGEDGFGSLAEFARGMLSKQMQMSVRSLPFRSTPVNSRRLRDGEDARAPDEARIYCISMYILFKGPV